MTTQLKSGFTLAEVLITMAIIGIVAAILMPAVITSYQCKTVGVKLAKFASTVENSARAYVVSNDSFKTTNSSNNSSNSNNTAATQEENYINNFVNEVFIYKSIISSSTKPVLSNVKYTGLIGTEANNTLLALKGTESKDDKGTTTTNYLIGIMKDNTKVTVLPLSDDTSADDWATNSGTYKNRMALINKDKVGEGAFILVFDPNVTGLPKAVQKSFSFVVTELGYMFPAANDNCLWEIYSNDYTTNTNTFKGNGAACLNK